MGKALLFLLDIVCWICAFFPGGVGNFGKSVVTSIVFIMLIIDWKGVLTFDGKIDWKKFGGGKRVLLFCLYFMVLSLALLGYFVRRINASTAAKKQKLPELPYRKGRPAVAIKRKWHPVHLSQPALLASSYINIFTHTDSVLSHPNVWVFSGCPDCSQMAVRGWDILV